MLKVVRDHLVTKIFHRRCFCVVATLIVLGTSGFKFMERTRDTDIMNAEEEYGGGNVKELGVGNRTDVPELDLDPVEAVPPVGNPTGAPQSSNHDETVVESPVGHHKVLVEYKKADFRSFLFVLHESYGLLLLHCTRKQCKPPHWQLPGGHVDKKEFKDAGMSPLILCAFLFNFDATKKQLCSSLLKFGTLLFVAKHKGDRNGQLLLASMMAAARELFEETGIDVRSNLTRLEPAALRSHEKFDNKGKQLLPNEYKERLFFFLNVTDDDLLHAGGIGPIGNDEAFQRFQHVTVS
jgi:8-oxo-dGTP pyrophosphatase MutT (NUDIX family)